MLKPIALLKCIGVAVLKAAVKAIPLGDAIADVAQDVYAEWSKERKAEERRAELQAVAQSAADEVRAQVREIVREIAGDQPEAIQQNITMYLNQVPVAIHQSLRRPEDPTGTTIPPALEVLKPEDLIRFLPAKLPRFKPGDRPLLGVDWELVELLGVGGFGEVWKARNPHFDSVQPVALKFCLDPAAKEQLLRHEAAVLNQVMRQGRHSGIVPLRHTYLSADPPCLEYQYIEGGDLAGFIAHRSPGSRGLSAGKAAKIILRLAEIVGYAHRLTPPIVHRDLKPANILLEKSADNKLVIRVADFGIGGVAAGRDIDQTKHGLRPGELLTAVLRGAYTVLYASPQQMRGMSPDPRDDVHALGVIWYQLLTGDLSAGRPGGRGWKNRLAAKGMSTSWLDLLESCFEDNPGDRPPDAKVVAEKLKKLLVTETQENREEPISAAPVEISSTDQQLIRKAPETGQPQNVSQQGASPPVVIVSQRGDGQYASLGEAIRVVAPYSRIIVRPGLYQESIVLDKPLHLIGEGPLEDIVIQTRDANCLVMKAVYFLVRGLTIRSLAGDKDWSLDALKLLRDQHPKAQDFSLTEGFSVDVLRGKLVLEYCDITSEMFYCLRIKGPESDAIVRNCTLRGSRVAGIAFSKDAHGTIEDCTLLEHPHIGLLRI